LFGHRHNHRGEGHQHSHGEGHGHGRFHGRHAGPRGRFGGDDGFAGERGFGRGRRQRMFDGGDLRLVLLKLVAEKPRHGYDVIRAIEQRTAGAYVPSPGVIYPTLTMLGEMGFIEEQLAEGARKLFAITAEGTAHLEQHAEEVVALFAKLDALGQERERVDAVPVRRAMHNLRSVLQHRLGEGFDKDKLHEVVALIDEAASKIERL
jgi:DNA-binding PadR family transcriptional regulator